MAGNEKGLAVGPQTANIINHCPGCRQTKCWAQGGRKSTAMNFFPETEETCVCKECKKEFKAYHYYEDCTCCSNGETDDGEECGACHGMGEHNSIEKNTCQLCLYLYLTRDD